ncbi:MAG: hypothetical protein PHO30_07385 [Candidatus Omnitrophica bacterium]|nr:hypothetical protein [Candidatus Omnitrophota bacterium]
MVVVIVFLVLLIGGIGFFYLENYPSEIVNTILNKIQQNDTGFMNKTRYLLNPDTLQDVPEIETYVKNLREKILNRADGGMHSFRFKLNMVKGREDRYQVAKVIAKLLFSEAYKENQATVEFDFIRYDWWRWTVLNCKVISSTEDEKYH